MIVFLADVLSEDAILKWYKESHSSRGWSVFMDQMKKFIDWLENADEGIYLSFSVFNDFLCFVKFEPWRVFCFVFQIICAPK